MACPATSDRSGEVPMCGSAGGEGSAVSGSVGMWAGSPLRSHSTSSARVSTGTTVTPGTSPASAAFATGTTTQSAPASAAATTAGRTPRTGLTVPSSPSSPRKNGRETRCLGTRPAAPSNAIAIARSNRLPRLGRLAGKRLMVTRASGQAYLLLITAERTRSRASLRAVSSMPIRVTPAMPWPTSASTSTTWPLTPTSATQRVRATAI